MSWRQFIAPGKLVLLGEYAVIDGAPAIVMAVNRGVSVKVQGELSDVCHTIQTPHGDDRFVRAALTYINAPPGSYCFKDQQPIEGLSGKPGFGGSAAATVVAVFAGGILNQQIPIWTDALAIHRQVQGSGSGIDIAASWFGGLLKFKQSNIESLSTEIRPVVIWSGQSAQTGPRVSKYLAWPQRDAFLTASTHWVEQFHQQPILALQESQRELAAMTRSAGIDWATDAHDRITELAEHLGGAAKPSGAGGGDCAIALLPDVETEQRFIDQCQAMGFPKIDVQISSGVREIF